MQRLTCRRRLRDERGASAVLIALLMIPLLGFGALAVDVAALYSEKQQLQNGADAAALAIAHDCASALPACGVAQATADTLTEANYDEAGSAHGVPTVTFGTNEVTVTNPGTQGHWLAPILGFESTDVSASATVRWGAAGGGTAVLPLAFSWCAFEQQTGGGEPTGETPTVIDFTKADETEGCTGPNNLEVPGGFAWLDSESGECGATTEVDGTAYSDTGNSVPAECSPEYFESLLGETVLLPIFGEAGDTGSNAWYRIYAYAAFTITGYNFAGQYKSDPPADCGGTGSSGRCIEGVFTQFVDSTDDFSYDPAAPDLGAWVVQLVA
ncbi:pilus assembly protein TadG-related protein [Blastococcus sp. SYSU DS0973]